MAITIKKMSQLKTPLAGQPIRQRLPVLRRFFAAILFLAGLTLPGCGSGGGAAGSAPVATPGQTATVSMTTAVNQGTASQIATNYLVVAESDYQFAVTPNFYYSTDNQSFWSIQANLAQSVSDINSRTVIRIDIPRTGAQLPELNRTFAIEAGGGYDRFPGEFLVLDGQQSSRKRVESGTITFSADSVMAAHVSGSFNVVFTDYDSAVTPAPRYYLKGIFSFSIGGYGSAA